MGQKGGLSQLHGADIKQIEQVSIDMSATYAKAQIVWDRFHVMKNVGAAADEVRQREHRRLLAHDDARLRRTMRLWRHHPDSLSQEQTAHLDNLKNANLLTAKAYQMRLTLCDIYELPDPALMRRKLMVWSRWVMQWVRRHDDVLAPMKRAAMSIRKHLEGIIAFAHGRLSNTYMEAVNSVFSAVKRRARGYRTTKNLINILYFTAAKLEIPMQRVPR
ncbi:transposase [Cerasicoccus frondis]|uniref:transposase n=1 Tax=Cerasicoccus frondis TaxID=490090 RepID=UPI00285287F0|nr:transposase [Cerasicoccus frondis]